MLFKCFRYIAIISFFIFIFLECSLLAKTSKNDCIFDPGYFTKEKYKSLSGVEYVKWIDNIKEARIITRAGDLIAIKHWSCNHYGLEAKMYFNDHFKDTQALKRTLIDFIKIILDQTDFVKVRNRILKHKFSDHQENRLDFPKLGYSEFQLSIQSVSNSTIFILKYYRD